MGERHTNKAVPMVNLEIAGPVATIELARPPVNQVNDELLEQLGLVLSKIESNGSVAVVRIVSRQKAFSAGADLVMVRGRLGSRKGADAMMRTARLFHAVYGQLASLPAVTLAQIDGQALGGGLELALACDFRVAAYGAQLGLPEAKVGLLPGAGGTQRLTQLCGPGVAARIILGAELVDGREAERLGLVQWSFAVTQLELEVDAIVERIAALSPPALQLCKSCIQQAQPLRPEGVLAEIEGIGVLMETEEARRRVEVFFQR